MGDRMEFKDRLRFLRKNCVRNGKHVTQEDLGKVLGYKYTSISNYESGRNEPCIRDIIKIANFFEVSTDYLLCANESDEDDKRKNRLFDLCSSFNDDEKEKLVVIIKNIRLLADKPKKIGREPLKP